MLSDDVKFKVLCLVGYIVSALYFTWGYEPTKPKSNAQQKTSEKYPLYVEKLNKTPLQPQAVEEEEAFEHEA